MSIETAEQILNEREQKAKDAIHDIGEEIANLKTDAGAAEGKAQEKIEIKITKRNAELRKARQALADVKETRELLNKLVFNPRYVREVNRVERDVSSLMRKGTMPGKIKRLYRSRVARSLAILIAGATIGAGATNPDAVKTMSAKAKAQYESIYKKVFEILHPDQITPQEKREKQEIIDRLLGRRVQRAPSSAARVMAQGRRVPRGTQIRTASQRVPKRQAYATRIRRL